MYDIDQQSTQVDIVVIIIHGVVCKLEKWPFTGMAHLYMLEE